jgi:hypothetical protein
MRPPFIPLTSPARQPPSGLTRRFQDDALWSPVTSWRCWTSWTIRLIRTLFNLSRTPRALRSSLPVYPAHNARFATLMDGITPHWHRSRDEFKFAALAHGTAVIELSRRRTPSVGLTVLRTLEDYTLRLWAEVEVRPKQVHSRAIRALVSKRIGF